MILPEVVANCELRPAARPQQLVEAETAIGIALPSDYASLLCETDGFEGFAGAEDDVFLAFWSVSDIPTFNDAYFVSEFLPGVVLLGTDGGDTGYGFRVTDGAVEYLSVPLVGMGPDDVELMGGTFLAFLDRLVQ